MSYPRVSIQVLNWNRWQYTIRCLESLYQISYPNYDVILVDNGSEDDSIEKIKEWAEGKIPVEGKFFQYNPEGKPIRYIEYQRGEAEAGGSREEEISRLPSDKKLILIKNEQNYGFPKGSNIGIRYSLGVLNPEYVLLLQNDTVVSPGFLDELVNAANKELGAGILSAMVHRYDKPGAVFAVGAMINPWSLKMTQGETEITALAQFKDVIEVDLVGFACSLISRQVWQTVGLLDEAIFFNAEETDFCIRAAKQGFKVLVVPKSEVWHDLVRPPGYEERLKDIQMYNFPKSNLIVMYKHWTKLQFAYGFYFLAVHLVKFLLHCIIRRRDWNYLRLTWRGYWDFFKERKSYKREKDHLLIIIDREQRRSRLVRITKGGKQ